MYLRKNILAALLISGSASLANAQQVVKDSTNNLNEVVVNENRLKLPFSSQNRNIWIIDKEKIKTLPVRSVAELLSFVSGVDVRQRGPGGTQADISMDGGTFDETLVLLNGVKVSDPQTGHNMMNLPINMDDIDHIEVLRGSASRVYGLNAITGAINIVTRTPEKSGAALNVFTGSSFKKDASNGDTFANYGVRLSGDLVTKGASHLLSASQEASNGYRYNTAFNNQKVYYQGRIDLSDADQLDVSAGYIHNNFGANGFYSSPGDVESEETVKTALASVAYTRNITKNWTIAPRLSYRYNIDDYLYIKQTPDRFHNHHETGVLDAELNNTIQTSIGTFGLGLELRTENINSSNLGKRDRSNTGVYAEYKFEPLAGLLINAGTYVNYNSDYGWQAFPGIDAGYNFYGNWKVFMNLGTGQRLPTYTDLYYRGPTNIGNADLKSEQSKYGEAGLKYQDTKFTFNASYFQREITNFIDWVKAIQTDPWQPRNFSDVTTKGFTVSGDYLTNFGTSAKVNSLRIGASYTNLNPSFKTTITEATFSRYALESLRNQFSVTATAEAFNLLSLTLASRYNERINYKSYQVLDARLNVKLSRYQVYIDAANLLDVEYIEAGAVPMPGTWLTLGFKAKI
jgi:vitamin B12 transporter